MTESGFKKGFRDLGLRVWGFRDILSTRVRLIVLSDNSNGSDGHHNASWYECSDYT